MKRSIDSVISELSAFVPASEEDNVHRLNKLLDGFHLFADSERTSAMPAIFGLLEKYPDAEFGSPGPLVHELEAIPGYQPLLKVSLTKRPSSHGTWMVNRILNSNLPAAERAIWLARLQAVTTHPLAPQAVRESALGFLQYQAGGSDA